jgi:hypothetical protein
MISLILMANLHEFGKHVLCISVQYVQVQDDAPGQSTVYACSVCPRKPDFDDFTEHKLDP